MRLLPNRGDKRGIVTARAGSLAESTDGAVWEGSAAGNLVRIDPKTSAGTQWKLPEVYSVVADNAGHVWAATNNGLFVLDTNALASGPQLVNSDVFSNPRQRVSDLFLDSTNRLWVAADQGLVVHDPSGWHRIDSGATALAPDLIAVDQAGTVWACGASQDMMRLHIDHYRVVESRPIGRPPLLSQQAVSLMVDQRGWLWIGQDAGLTMFDGHSWRSYTQDDGLIWNDTDSFALAEDKDGKRLDWNFGWNFEPLDCSERRGAAAAPQAPAFSQRDLWEQGVDQQFPHCRGVRGSWKFRWRCFRSKWSQDGGIRYRLIGGQATDWEVTRGMDVHYHDLAPGDYRFEVSESDLAAEPSILRR